MVSRIAMHGGFVVTSLICILLAHYAAVLPHEYAHSFMAFALGYKSDPLVIHFGGTSVGNLVSLININEQVDYAPMFARADGRAAALTGFAGPGLANGSLYLLSLFLLRRPGVQRNVLLYMLVFWFNFMNVANFYDYVPIRTFASGGDIGHITQGLGLSPWTALVVLGIPTAIAMWFLFTRTLPRALGRMAPEFFLPTALHRQPERRDHVRLFRPCRIHGLRRAVAHAVRDIAMPHPDHADPVLALTALDAGPRRSFPRPDGTQSLKPSAIAASTAICRPQAVR